MNYDIIDTTPRPITLLLKGDSGTGKTYKAGFFPNPVFFNFDNNMGSIRRIPDAYRKDIRILNPAIAQATGKKVLETKIWDNFISQLEKVCEDPTVDTIVIDSFTTMCERLFDKLVGSPQPDVKVQIQHYGDFARYIKWLGDTLLAAPDLDKHVIIIAHENTEIDRMTEEVVRTLACPTKIKNTFGLYFSDVWQCQAKATIKGVDYLVRTAPGSNFSAKTTLDLPTTFRWDDMVDNILAQISLPKQQETTTK